MKSAFSYIFTAVFIILAIFGILVFSGIIKIGDEGGVGSLGTVTLWGTFNNEALTTIVDEFNTANPSLVLKYVQKSADTFDRELLEALAENKGPDMIFLPDNLAFQYSNKIFPIPLESYSLNSFKNNFASAGEIFISPKGILALPISIDPMILYYNQSMLDSEGVVYPPSSWDEVMSLVPVLTKKDQTNKIIKSAIAFGHFSNITHAKNILTTLFMQDGNPIITEEGGKFISTLDKFKGKTSEGVLKFYTDFADPTNSLYSWNKSFSSSLDSFSREDLAFYLGYGSELPLLLNKNPNLNFNLASFPQVKDSKFKLTGSRVWGLAVLKNSKNLNTAISTINLLSMSDFASKLSFNLNFAPARRNLLSKKQKDAYWPIIYSSALYARSWLDPSPKDSDIIFRRMIEGILSNSFDIDDGLIDASGKLNLLLLK